MHQIPAPNAKVYKIFAKSLTIYLVIIIYQKLATINSHIINNIIALEQVFHIPKSITNIYLIHSNNTVLKVSEEK